MKKIKRIRVLLTIILIMGLVFPATMIVKGNSEVKNPQRIMMNKPDQNNSVLLLYVPFGDGIDNISFQGGNEQEVLAPEGFYITEDGTIYICDTVNARVFAYKNNNIVSKIDIDKQYTIIDIFVKNQDDIYLLDDNYRILKTSLSGIIESIYEIPIIKDNATLQNPDVYYTPKSIYLNGDNLIVEFSNYAEYALINGSLERTNTYDYSCTLNGNVPYVEDKNNKKRTYQEINGSALEIEMLKIDKNTNSYLRIFELYQDQENMDYIFEESIRVINNDILKSVVYLLSSDGFFVPNKNIFISDEGNIYQMLVTQNGLNIYELIKSSTSVSKIKEYKKEKSKSNIFGKLGNSISNIFDFTSNSAQAATYNYVNKSDVFYQMNYWKDYKWVFNSANHSNYQIVIDNNQSYSNLAYIEADCVQPKWLRDLSKNVNHDVVGMPYCWGGYDDSASFQSKLSDNYFVGNTCAHMHNSLVGDDNKLDTNGNKIYHGYFNGTAGQDCSGYVSLCFDLPYKHSTQTLQQSDGGPFESIGWDSVGMYDILNKRKSHVIIVENVTRDINNNVIGVNVYEEVAGQGKVSISNYSSSQLVGYEPFRYMYFSDTATITPQPTIAPSPTPIPCPHAWTNCDDTICNLNCGFTRSANTYTDNWVAVKTESHCRNSVRTCGRCGGKVIVSSDYSHNWLNCDDTQCDDCGFIRSANTYTDNWVAVKTESHCRDSVRTCGRCGGTVILSYDYSHNWLNCDDTQCDDCGLTRSANTYTDNWVAVKTESHCRDSVRTCGRCGGKVILSYDYSHNWLNCDDTQCDDCGLTRSANTYTYKWVDVSAEKLCQNYIKTCGRCGVGAVESNDYTHNWANCDSTQCSDCAFTRNANSYTYKWVDVSIADHCEDYVKTCARCGNDTIAASDYTHSWTNCDDTSCNDCLYTRDANVYTYVWKDISTADHCEDYIKTCRRCGNEEIITSGYTHYYADCDATKCNFCAFSREANTYSYAWKDVSTANHCEDYVKTCGRCGAGEIVSYDYTHYWTNCDDTSCNDCQYTRAANTYRYTWVDVSTASHCEDYVKTCARCGKDEIISYDYVHYWASCDATQCSNCSYTRSANTYSYAWVDVSTSGHCEDYVKTCNRCGKGQVISYDYTHFWINCDSTQCNDCAYTRSANTYSYAWVDVKTASHCEDYVKTCNRCGDKQILIYDYTHYYNPSTSRTCSDCGYIR